MGVLFDGLGTLLVRQVLFGMMKFLVFDYFADFVFDLLPVLAEKTETQLLVSFISGAVAGLSSSIISQPADTILTRMNQPLGPGIQKPRSLNSALDDCSAQVPGPSLLP